MTELDLLNAATEFAPPVALFVIAGYVLKPIVKEIVEFRKADMGMWSDLQNKLQAVVVGNTEAMTRMASALENNSQILRENAQIIRETSQIMHENAQKLSAIATERKCPYSTEGG